MSKMTDAQKRANYKYQKKVYTQICYKIRKDFKTEIENHILKTNETVNGFITRAVKNQIEIDNRTTATENAENSPAKKANISY